MKIIFDGQEQGNVFDFVEKLGFPKEHVKKFNKEEEFFLVTKTVKFGKISDEIEKFLEKKSHLAIGVAVSGNKNYGSNFGKAGELISKKFNIPLILKFEGKGFSEDIVFLQKWLKNYKKENKKMDKN
uniref:class Ib ribonucleoside-diphosphate reductase assembly flavoprotein NrdI n=1 Tax=Italian clover phyllody phytoplasma TaxID=1196420 RepID=UPI00036302B9